MASLVNDEGIVSLSGTVGFLGMPDHFTHADVANSLAMIGRDKDVILKINSGGGIATEGAAIYSALKDHKGKVTVRVEGVAASAASLIAMAGDDIEMGFGAIMMIHDPATITIGNAADHKKTIESLDALGNSYASIYAERSGLSVEDARNAMRETTWMSGEDAVKRGFATSFKGKGSKVEPTAFAYSLYQNAPQELVALASTRGWRGLVSVADPKKEVALTDEEKLLMNSSPLDHLIPTDDDSDEHADDDNGDDDNGDDDKADDNADDKKPTASVAADIVDACNTAGVPMMAASLIRENVDLPTAQARITAAGEVRTLVANAAKQFPKIIEASAADEFIKNGTGLDAVRAALFDKIVASQSPELSPQVIVADKKPASAAWDKAIEAHNARV